MKHCYSSLKRSKQSIIKLAIAVKLCMLVWLPELALKTTMDK
jgi:hypothetical protein